VHHECSKPVDAAESSAKALAELVSLGPHRAVGAREEQRVRCAVEQSSRWQDARRSVLIERRQGRNPDWRAAA